MEMRTTCQSNNASAFQVSGLVVDRVDRDLTNIDSVAIYGLLRVADQHGKHLGFFQETGLG